MLDLWRRVFSQDHRIGGIVLLDVLRLLGNVEKTRKKEILGWMK